MNFDDYTQKVVELASPHFHSELVPVDAFVLAAGALVNNGALLDAMKKALFYGKTDPKLAPLIESLPFSEPVMYSETSRLIHAVTGIATEAVEILDLLKTALVQKSFVDDDAIVNETGDLLWYIALLLNELDIDMESVMKINMTKLKKRFPDKFSSELAINKDTQSENEAILSSR